MSCYGDLYLSGGRGHVEYNRDTDLHGRYPVGTVATSVCDRGYWLYGREFITCDESGDWDGYVAHCFLSQ